MTWTSDEKQIKTQLLFINKLWYLFSNSSNSQIILLSYRIVYIVDSLLRLTKHNFAYQLTSTYYNRGRSVGH